MPLTPEQEAREKIDQRLVRLVYFSLRSIIMTKVAAAILKLLDFLVVNSVVNFMIHLTIPKAKSRLIGGFAGKIYGGSDGARTRDLRRDRPALWTKLSYAPGA